MPALIQFCIVIVTAALLAFVVAILIGVTRFFQKTAADLREISVAVRESATTFDLVTREMHDLVDSLEECVPPVRRVVERFAAIGHRTADLSATILEEVEAPVFTAAALGRGVRVGAGHLLARLIHRISNRNSNLQGGNNHE